MTQYVRVYFDIGDNVVHVETNEQPFRVPFIEAPNISYVKECELDDVTYTEAELVQLYESLGFSPRLASEAVENLKQLSLANGGVTVEPSEPAFPELMGIRLNYDGETTQVREFRRARELVDNMETDGVGGVKLADSYQREKTLRNVRDAKDPRDKSEREIQER